VEARGKQPPHAPADLARADPFFCSIWPSSIALAENLLKQPKLALGKRVIDAGCGLGLGGVAAALAGARAVVLADREPFALRCALQTAQANGLTPLPLELAASGGAGPVVRSVLQPASGAAGSGTIGALELDWHAPPAELRGCFDVMTACDVLYEKSAAVPVAALALHLLAPGGTLLLADPPLRTPGNRKDFLALLDSKFEAVKTEEQRIFDADGKPVDVCICVFTGKR
jgi:predicted nicotinamide N-methyase